MIPPTPSLPHPLRLSPPSQASVGPVSGSEYSALLDALQELVLVLDLKGVILHANRALCQALGYDLSELAGEQLLTLYASAARPDAIRALSEMVDGRLAASRVPLLARGGRELAVETRIQRSTWGGVPAILCLSRKLDSQPPRDPVLCDKAKRSNTGPGGGYLSAILDNFPYLIWLKDANGRFQAVNQVFSESCGHPGPDSVLGLTDFDVWPRERAEQYVADDQLVLSGGGKKHVEELIADHGVERWFETYKSPVRDPRGEIIGTAGFARDITERKLAEEELRVSRQQFLTVLDHIDAIVYVTDLETNELLFVNRKLKELNPEAHVGRKCWEVLQFGQSGPCDFCTNHRLRPVDELPPPTVTWEYFSTRAQRWLECRDTVIRWHDGRICRLEIATDITERKTLEESLRHQVNFESLVVSLSMRFIYLDPDTLDTEIERALASVGEVTGIDRSAVFLFGAHRMRMRNTHEWCAEGIPSLLATAREIETSLAPWLMERLSARESIHVRSATDLPATARTEKAILLSRGTQSAVIVPVMRTTRLLGLIGFEAVREPREWTAEEVRLLRVVADIFGNALERLQILRALRSSESRHRGLLSAIPDLMFRLNRRAEILDVARGHQDDPRLNRESLAGSRIDRFLDPSDVPVLLDAIGQTLHSGAMMSRECLFDFGQGMETHEVRVSPSGTDEVIAIVRNVNERAKLDRMRSDFINDASHELRTPLATIIMMADLLQAGGEEEEIREYWRVLKCELDRAQLLIDDLLTVGRLESGRLDIRPQPMALGEVILQELHSAQPILENRQIDLDLKVDLSTLPMINGSPGALRQVFANLLSNAVKFTPSRGQVTLNAEPVGGRLLVRVSDTGIGIPPHEIHQLFDRFFRASNALAEDIHGSGMGLYIIRAILRELDGSISVESVLGSGSTFTVDLPLADSIGRPPQLV